MASPATIHKAVKTLCSAHGRPATKETYDAYEIALGEFSDTEVERALVTTLREQREFMAPPGIVAGFARDVRISNARNERREEERRVKCLDCEDRGFVYIVARKWLYEHRDAFKPEWFVDGWMKDATAWCHANKVKGLVQVAACNCDSYMAKLYRNQQYRYRDMKKSGIHDEKKNPLPSFGLTRQEADCVVPTMASVDVQNAIMAWTEQDRDGRSWSGNWNP